MLTVFQDLTIRGDREHLERLVASFSAAPGAGWSQASDYSPGGTVKGHTFRWQGNAGLPAARLFLFYLQQTLKVTNIVPVTIRELSFEQYNAILEDFAARIRPFAEREGLLATLSPSQLDLVDWLSPEAAERLTCFSKSANRNVFHPNDRKRWNHFLVQAHEDEQKGHPVDAGLLERWLTEEDGWPGDEACKLIIEFDHARDLLALHDQPR